MHFDTHEGVVRAVNGVSFEMRRGRTTALVGESGCGKSVTSFSILRLIQKPGRIVDGSITYLPSEGDAIDVTELDESEDAIFDLRGGKIGMVFQEPMTALSPVHTVGEQIAEGVRIHTGADDEAARERAIEILGRVGIPNTAQRVDQYPFEMSGGMRQRVVIAMALACRPDVLIADEPTTALDVTIQAQILDLLQTLRRDRGTALVLITHDMGVVAETTERLVVMYAGQAVEQGPTAEVLARPRHPYTAALLDALPERAPAGQPLATIPGIVPGIGDRPPGCVFNPRCRHAEARCRVEMPAFDANDPRATRCHYPLDGGA